MLKNEHWNETDLKDDSKDTLSFDQGAFLTLLSEAKRRNWKQEQVSDYLETSLESNEKTSFNQDLYHYIGEKLEQTRIGQRYCLTSFRSQVMFEAYNCQRGRLCQPHCFLELTFKDSKMKNESKVVFKMDTVQLEDLLWRLRDMQNCLKRV